MLRFGRSSDRLLPPLPSSHPLLILPRPARSLQIPVELAKQAEHWETAELMLEYMRKCPHVFAPMQGTPTVHQHKQMKLEDGGLHHFNDDM